MYVEFLKKGKDVFYHQWKIFFNFKFNNMSQDVNHSETLLYRFSKLP